MGKARKYKPFSKEDADAYAGKGGLSNFFPVVPKKKKRGRPAKNAKKRGRPPRNNKSPPTPPPHLRKSPPEIAAANNDGNDGVGPVEEDGEEEEDDDVDNEDAGAPKKKRSRINWGAPPHRAKMETAINDWFQKTGDAVDSNGEAIEDAKIFAGLVDIPYNTLYKYIQPNEVTRRILGNGDRGPPKLLEDLYPSPAKKFEMLPSFWRGMKPSERRVAMTIMNTHGGKFTTDCLSMLKSQCNLSISQLTDIRVCIIIAREHPETLDFEPGGSQNDDHANESSVSAIEEARAEAEDLNAGLDYYQLNPKDPVSGKPKYSGEKLLEHMCGFRNRMFANEVSIDDDCASKPPPRQEPSPYLDLHLYDDNLRAIMPSKNDFNRGNVMSHAHGQRAQRKMAERKLTNIGTVTGHCGLVTSEEHISRLREQYEFVKSIAEINRRSANQKKKKEEDSRKELEKNAPAAAIKLETKNRNVDLLSVREIEAILYQVYNVLMQGKSKLRKSDYVKKLEEEMAKNIAKYELFLSSARAASETTAAVASPENDKELADEAIN